MPAPGKGRKKKSRKQKQAVQTQQRLVEILFRESLKEIGKKEKKD